MTISIADAILEAADVLQRAHVPDARRDAGSLLGHALGQDRSFILSHADDTISAEQRRTFENYVARRAQREPMQYIIGKQEFYGLDFEVTRDVLIPRPETELLIEAALSLVPRDGTAMSICDVGTGSGCIAITLLHELRKEPVSAVAVDISPLALEVAKRNAARHSLTKRIEFIVSDCFAALNPGDPNQSRFDLIVSNPPYVAERALDGLQTEVREFEPRAALTAGPDGLLVIRRLLVEAASFLKPAGHFLFEIGFDQSVAVQALIDPKVWKLLRIHKDLQGIPRTVALQKPA